MRNKFQNSFQRLGGLQGHGTAENLIEIVLGVSICKSGNYKICLKREKREEIIQMRRIFLMGLTVKMQE